MNARKSWIPIWTAPIFAWSALAALTPPSNATTANIACNTNADTPTVMATISERGTAKNVSILSFLPQYFSPQAAVQKCQETANTLQALYNTGNAKYLTAEKLNGQTVVCAVERRGTGCDRYSAKVLFTLDRAANPSQALYDMLGSDFKQSQPPNSRTVSRIYSDIKPRWWF
jgi:hypothetical protein